MHTALLNNFLYAFIAIFPMVNPIAMSTIFHGVTESATRQERKKLAAQITLYGIILLLITLVAGPFLLKFFGLQPADIRIAGGLVVFAVAWKMLNQPKQVKSLDTALAEDDEDSIMNQAFFPLTMPFTAGPGAIAIVVALAADAAAKKSNLLANFLPIALAIIVVFIFVYIFYRLSSTMFRLLGKSGSKAIGSLSAFILLAIGVSVTWSGIQTLLINSTELHSAIYKNVQTEMSNTPNLK